LGQKHWLYEKLEVKVLTLNVKKRITRGALVINSNCADPNLEQRSNPYHWGNVADKKKKKKKKKKTGIRDVYSRRTRILAVKKVRNGDENQPEENAHSQKRKNTPLDKQKNRKKNVGPRKEKGQ